MTEMSLRRVGRLSSMAFLVGVTDAHFPWFSQIEVRARLDSLVFVALRIKEEYPDLERITEVRFECVSRKARHGDWVIAVWFDANPVVIFELVSL